MLPGLYSVRLHVAGGRRHGTGTCRAIGTPVVPQNSKLPASILNSGPGLATFELETLRDEITKTYSSVSAEEVLVLAPQEGIYLAMLAMLKAGDTVVAMFPGYASLYECARAQGCTVKTWQPRKNADGRLHFELDDLAALMDGDADVKALVINFPHNPTGDLLSRDEQRALVALCQRSACWLFSDEMYRGLEADPEDSLPSAVDVYDKAIALGGMSKSLSGPGLRIGWLAMKSTELMQRIMSLKDYTTICSSAPSEVLSIMALRQSERIVAKNMSIVKRNVAAAQAFFDEHEDLFEWHAPAAGTTAFPRLKGGRDVAAWCDKVNREAGILLLPGSVYEHPGLTDAGHFRLGMGRKDFPAGLAALNEFLAS